MICTWGNTKIIFHGRSVHINTLIRRGVQLKTGKFFFYFLKAFIIIRSWWLMRFSPFLCLDATKFALLSVFTRIETICQRICSENGRRVQKLHFRLTWSLKTSLLKLPIKYCQWNVNRGTQKREIKVTQNINFCKKICGQTLLQRHKYKRPMCRITINQSLVCHATITFFF